MCINAFACTYDAILYTAAQMRRYLIWISCQLHSEHNGIFPFILNRKLFIHFDWRRDFRMVNASNESSLFIHGQCLPIHWQWINQKMNFSLENRKRNICFDHHMNVSIIIFKVRRSFREKGFSFLLFSTRPNGH